MKSKRSKAENNKTELSRAERSRAHQGVQKRNNKWNESVRYNTTLSM